MYDGYEADIEEIKDPEMREDIERIVKGIYEATEWSEIVKIFWDEGLGKIALRLDPRFISLGGALGIPKPLYESLKLKSKEFNVDVGF